MIGQEQKRCGTCGGPVVAFPSGGWFCQACVGRTVRKEQEQADPISPQHYQKRGIEVRHVIRAFECSYNIGTAVAYLLRAQFKKDYIEDLRKAAKHIQFELEDKFKPGDTAIDKGGDSGSGVGGDRTK